MGERYNGSSTCSMVGIMSLIVGLMQVVLFLSATLLVAANIWMLIEIAPGVDDVPSSMAVILRIYNVLLTGLVILSLFDFQWMLTYTYFLLTYIGSGLFQVFVGIMTLGSRDVYILAIQEVEDQTGFDTQTIDTARTTAGWIMVSVGLVYIVLALFNFPQMKKRRDFVRLSKTSLNGSQASGLSNV